MDLCAGRRAALDDDYAAAWDEWDRSGEEAVWSGTVGDEVAELDRTAAGTARIVELLMPDDRR